MAEEKPELRLHRELCTDHSLAVLAARLADFGDPIKHQHRRQRQLRIARAEQLATAASEQVFVFEAVPPRFHGRRVLMQLAWLNSHASLGNIPSLTGKDGERRMNVGFGL